MKVSKQAYYGLRAVITLAQMDNPLSIRELAEREHLPEPYLEKILQKLRRAGVVSAEKGASGGYALAKKRDAINAWDIVHTLDSPMQTFTLPKGRLPCLEVSHCQTNEVWRAVERSVEKTLNNISVASLIKNNQNFQ